MRRWIAAGALLFAAYAALTIVTSPRGFLGTDTGGKVATLRVMDRCRCADPDVGYWAERWDTDGSLHPLYLTGPVGDRWVNLSTLPMPLAARPLFAAGGYRAALVFPMLGSLAAAFAAAALARRLGARDDGRLAFWVVGLASPMTIYALDFWEHSIGVALIAWAVVLVIDVVTGDGNAWRRAALAGLILGTAATMRTEAFVYTAVLGATALAVLALGRAESRMRDAARPRAVVAAAVAFAVPLLANVALERAVFGTGLRATRTTGTALLAGDEPANRVVEGAFTVLALQGNGRGVALGMVTAALLAFAARSHRAREDETFAVATVAAAGALYAVRFLAGGLGFVPGLLAAWLAAPASAAAASTRRTKANVVVLGVALGAIPIVLATQFRGGAAPQWAGRYLLASGLLLTVAGLVALADRPKARIAVVTLAVAVTTAGVAWLAVRSHDVERTIATIERRREPVIVSTVAHLAREGGATYGDRRWLTAVGPAAVDEAARVVADAGYDEFVLVEYQPRGPRTIEEASPVGEPASLRLFDGVVLTLTTWSVEG